MTDLLISDVRPWGGEPSDLVVTDGVITAITPTSATDRPTSAPGTTLVEGRGRLALPSFADVHVHLDSTRLGLPFRPHTGAPGVWAMMLNDRDNWRDAEASIAERTTTTLGLMIARGTTVVRS